MSNPYATPEQQDPDVAPASLAQSIRGLQIITIAMVVGVLVFMGICLVMTGGALDGSPDIVSWIGLGFAGLMIVSHIVFPNIVAKAALAKITAEQIREADDAKKLELIFPVFQSRHIVAVALLEGAAFFNLIAYITSKYKWNIGAAFVLALLIFARLLTTTAAMFWVNDRAREIEMS